MATTPAVLFTNTFSELKKYLTLQILLPCEYSFNYSKYPVALVIGPHAVKRI